MKIERNPKRETLVLNQIRKSFTDEGPRTGVHLSDLLSPRRSYWSRVRPLDPTNSDVLYWLAGRGHEDALGRVAGLVVTEQKFWHPTSDIPSTLPISYRPDFTFNGLFPGEFKTRRWNLPEPGEEAIQFESYLEQLRGYCAIEGSNYGLLLVLSLLEGKNRNDPMSKSEPALAAYDVFFSDEELAGTREWLEERRDTFVTALMSRDHTTLPLCKDWMCGKPKKVIDQGAYCHKCEKEVNHKPAHEHVIAGHVQPAVEHWEYEVRCKWYDVCRPQDVDPSRGERRSA